MIHKKGNLASTIPLSSSTSPVGGHVPLDRVDPESSCGYGEKRSTLYDFNWSNFECNYTIQIDS